MNSLARRTVQLLDREPGQPAPESKAVRGVKIEKGIPIPGTHQRGKWKTVMDAMEVGESFVDTVRRKLDKDDTIPGREYVSRKVPGGYRVWRTK